MIKSYAFVDEPKAKDYLLVSAMFAETELNEARKAVRGLLLPGQPRLHMKNENERRRRRILSAIRAIARSTDLSSSR